MRLIDGRAIADAIRQQVATTVDELAAANIVPTLAVLVSTKDEASEWYIRSIERAATRIGVVCRVERLDAPTIADLTQRLDDLSADPAVHGVLCQSPLPEGIRLDRVAAHIAPGKDVDGANPTSLGRLAVGLPTFVPATAAAVIEILHWERVPLAGTTVVVVGRSTVVGKPTALLMLAEHATVTVCHSRTADLATVCAGADVLVVATGRAHLIGADHVKPGAVIVDVGTNPTPGGLIGDVDARAVAPKAHALTPVPGGVGPVTTMALLRQTVAAAAGRRPLPGEDDTC